MSMLRLLASMLICLGTMSGWAWAQPAPAQQGVVIDREYEIKAKYLYYLAVFVKPAVPESGTAKPLQIVVIGQPGTKFEETTRQTPYLSIKDKRSVQTVEWLIVKSLDDFKSKVPKTAPPRIVFLLSDSAGTKLDEDVATLAEHLSDAPTMIVTEDNQKFRQTVAVNFYEDQAANRVRMQVREASLKERNLAAVPDFLKSPAVLKY